MDSYTYEVNQVDLNHLELKVKVSAPGKPRRQQSLGVRPVRGSDRFMVTNSIGDRITTHRTYDAACAKAQRILLTWLHSVLGTGVKRPSKFP